LANEARNFQLPGVLCGFHPRAVAAAGGRWASTRPAVENCGLRWGETAGGGWGPHPTPLALSPLPTLGEGRGGTRLLSFWRRCRGVRGEGWDGRQLKTAAFERRNRLRRLIAAPARGLCKRSPQLPVAGRSVRFPPTGGGRGRRGVGPRHGRQLKTAAFTCETAGGGWSQPPQGDLANEARNFQLPGVLCGFHPCTMAAAEGRCGSGRPAVGNCGLHLRNRLRRLIAAPAGGLADEARNVQLPGVLCGSTHGRWPRPKGVGHDTAGS